MRSDWNWLRCRGLRARTVLCSAAMSAVFGSPHGASAQIVPLPTGADGEGQVFAFGDFNGDGQQDMAVAAQSGVVVLLNTARGLEPVAPLVPAGLLGSDAGDGVARALAAADFDGDGRDDLAIGVPGAAQGEGRVVLFRGFRTGLLPVTAILQAGTDEDVPATREFGSTLMAGDFNGDKRTDLIVGAPGTTRRADRTGSGALFLFRGVPMDVSRGSMLVREKARLEEELAGLAARDAGERLGSALALGDFDGDGRDDIAASAPGTQAGGGETAGVVFVFRGTGSSLRLNRRLRQLVLPPGSAVAQSKAARDAGDGFGNALTVGDFDGDGRDDLIVGAPRAAVLETAAFRRGTPVVTIPSFMEPPPGVPTDPTAVPQLGFALEPLLGGLLDPLLKPLDPLLDPLLGPLAPVLNPLLGVLLPAAPPAGSAAPSGTQELATNVPDDPDAVVTSVRAGAVFVFRGTDLGLEADRALDQRLVAPARDGVRPGNESGDRFGAALAAGDFDGDQLDDLAVGTPGEGLPTAQSSGASTRAGAVFVFRGTGEGLVRAAEQTLSSASGGFAAPRVGDEFGGAAAAADLDGDGRAELAVAAPGRALQAGDAGSGNVFVFGGAASGLRSSAPLESTALRADSRD